MISKTCSDAGKWKNGIMKVDTSTDGNTISLSIPSFQLSISPDNEQESNYSPYIRGISLLDFGARW